MKEVTTDELNKITGGTDISASIINAFVNVIKLLIDAGYMSVKIEKLKKHKKLVLTVILIILLPAFNFLFVLCYNTGNYVGIFLRNIYKIITKC